jgi:hypothetical protein
MRSLVDLGPESATSQEEWPIGKGLFVATLGAIAIWLAILTVVFMVLKSFHVI